MLDVGDRVAGFAVESFVARGGMAFVYKARDLRLSRTVALKVMAPELATDQSFRQRFTRESELAASIDHPNIIPIYAAGEENGLLYLVMRFVPGDHLGAVLTKNPKLDPPEVIAIFSQVAEALDAAHAHGLAHRDVKPANILLAGDGALIDRHAYLSDFGLTTKISPDAEMTTEHGVLGTLKYVAPERITGSGSDHRADIYSFGCVLFEALAGQPPFVREEEHAWLYAHVTEPPPRLTSYRPDLPPAIDDVLFRALAKKPADRYADCRSLMRDFRAAIEHRSPAPAPPAFDPYAPGADATTALPTIQSSASSAASGPSASSGPLRQPIWPPSRSPSGPSAGPSAGPPAGPPTGPPGPPAGAPAAAFASTPTPTPTPTPTAGSTSVGPDPNFRPYQATPPTLPPSGSPSTRSGGGSRRLLPILLVAAAVVLVAAVVVAAVVWLRPQLPLGSAPPGSAPPPEVPATPASILPKSADPLPANVFLWRHVDDGDLKIETATLDGEPVRTLLSFKGDRAAMLSPDRRTVLYLRETDGVQSLRAMTADGDGDVELFSDGTADCPRLGRPSLRADDVVVAVCYERANGPGRLNVMTITGKIVRTLDQGWVGDPAFSRDGSTVAYWKGGTYGRVGGQLRLVRLDGSGQQVLLEGQDGELADPTWSPTADVLVYRVWQGDDRWLMSVPVTDGRAGKPTQVTPRKYFDQGPSWSPDGTQVAFRRGSDQASELMVVGADGSNERSIVSNDGYSAGPVWTAR